MAGKISQMTVGGALSGSELIEMVQNNGTYSTSPNAITTYVKADPEVPSKGYVDTQVASVSAAAETILILKLLQLVQQQMNHSQMNHMLILRLHRLVQQQRNIPILKLQQLAEQRDHL
jgi:hypothetical protein